MKTNREKPTVRYSEAFKLQIVRELEQGQINFADARRKYGIKGADTIQRWLGQYGNGSVGKVIRVQKPEERNEREQMKRRIRALESALADANIGWALERQYTRLACERAGIEDVEEFKKKARGLQPTVP
jgi:transposase-like protein